MMLMSSIIGVVAVFSVAVNAQAGLDDVSCIGPLTSARNCNAYTSILAAVDTLRGAAVASQYCPQSVLNAIAGCQEEYRLCYMGYDFDDDFTGTTGFFSLWHSACDGFLTYAPTTPAISSLSMTGDTEKCLTAESYCNQFGLSTDECKASSQANLQDCYCQSTVLDLASRCEIDGSVSCVLQTPIETNMFSYRQCRSAGAAQTTAVGASSTAPALSTRITNGASPVSSASQSTPTQTGSNTPSSTGSGTALSSASSYWGGTWEIAVFFTMSLMVLFLM